MSMSLWAGQQHLGKYELRERLGYGGAAEVWKAFDTELQRYVAIKILHTDLQTDPEFITRFSREARFIASLHHPNVVKVHDFQTTYSPEVNAPIAYMVMDYVEGETLAHYLHRTSRAGQFPSPTEIVHLFASISKAIDYAHQEGMIHRDIKPANILLDKRNTAPDSIGEPVLTDFGIARIMGTSSGTMSGVWLGTPLYISPEQAQGYPGTKHSDIYALGVILYELCTGVCPFSGENATAIMAQQINAPPPPPTLINPSIPPALAATILRAMAKDPAARFSSASALTAGIAKALRVPVPTDLLLPADTPDDLLGSTHMSPRQSVHPLSITQQGTQRSQPLPGLASLPQTPSPTLTAPAPQTPFPVMTAPIFAGSSLGETGFSVTPTNSTPFPPPPPFAGQNAQATAPSAVPATKFPSLPPFLRPGRPARARKGQFLAWLVILLVLASSIFFVLNTLYGGRANPTSAPPPKTAGTLIFTDTGQYDPGTTIGYNDIVTLSLHSLASPQAGMALFAWLMPDQGDETTASILLGRLSLNAGDATLQYASPAHTNLLAQYSGVRITEESSNYAPSNPSPDPTTWRWEGWVPHTPTPGDPNQFSMVSHFRHLLAKDPTLQKNQLSGGLGIWMTRNVGKVEEWSSAAQGSWGDKNPELIHRHMLRILDYLDGQAYVWQDVPAESPWLVDPLAGKLGLLSYTQDQQPPGYLPHVEHHLTGLADSPGHTEEQKKVAIQVHDDITRMINDLTKVRKNAIQLVQRSNEQLLQPDTLALLNEMATLTRGAYSGWFDPITSQNRGGVIWITARIQQLATISLKASRQ